MGADIGASFRYRLSDTVRLFTQFRRVWGRRARADMPYLTPASGSDGIGGFTRWRTRWAVGPGNFRKPPVFNEINND